MCGITGFIDFSQSRSGDAAEGILRAMTDKMEHRGPDDSGHWMDGSAGVALGFRRLAIQDLSQDGAQPMQSPSGRYVIVYNGEIYNFLELRRELEAVTSPQWRGHSDTEVMLAAITYWGLEEAVRRFDGMFAFALWDREDRSLTLVRDRMGEKPLYLGWAGKCFLFGSELKAIMAHPELSAAIDPNAVAGLLRYNYVPAPASILQGIGKLPPGGMAQIDADGVETRRTYWDSLSEAESVVPYVGDAAAASRQLEQLLQRSVSRRMMSDVPLGAFLSGGIDSATIVALMQRSASRPVRSFTIGFDDKRFDEAPMARAIASHLGTDHTEVYVSAKDSLSLINYLPSVYDEPFADISQLPTLLLCRLARQEVTVAMTGDGGDELFGGYPRYPKAVQQWNTDAPLSKGILNAIPFGWLNLLSSGLGKPGRFGDKLWRKMVDRTKPSIELLYEGYMSRWRVVDRPMADPSYGYFIEGTRRPKVDDDMLRLMLCDTITYLPDDLLVKVDRASMATSLETRAPMLSHDVAKFAWSLPTDLKNLDGVGKRVLRSVLERHVPLSLFDRPKAGFEPPLAAWLRGPLRDWAQSLISSDRLASDGLLDPEPIRAVWEEHLKGHRNWHFELWNVLMLQSWREAWKL